MAPAPSPSRPSIAKKQKTSSRSTSHKKKKILRRVSSLSSASKSAGSSADKKSKRKRLAPPGPTTNTTSAAAADKNNDDNNNNNNNVVVTQSQPCADDPPVDAEDCTADDRCLFEPPAVHRKSGSANKKDDYYLLPQQVKMVFVPKKDEYYSWLRKDLVAKCKVDGDDYPVRSKWLGPAIQQAKHHFHIKYDRKPKPKTDVCAGAASATRQSTRVSLIADDAKPVASTTYKPHPSFDFQSTQLRRLVTEDMLLLEPGRHVLIAVTKSHPYFLSTWKKCLDVLEADCLANDEPPPVPVQIGGKLFFSFDVTIKDTPSRERLIGGQVSREEFQVAFSMQQGASLHIEIECTGDEIQMKYAELLECRDTFQMWALSPQVRKTRPLFRTRPSPIARLKLFSVLSSELEGDTAQSLDLCNVVNSLMDADDYKAMTALKNEGSITWCQDNEAISKFNAAINTIYQKHIMATYGEFTSFCEGIPSQSDVVEMVRMFKTDMAPTYKLISNLLNYENGRRVSARTSHLNPLYDRICMYMYLSMERVRNSQSLVWFAVSRAAVAYGLGEHTSLRQHAVFYGHSCTQKSMLQLLSAFSSIKEVMEKCRKMLRAAVMVCGHYLCLWAYDNGQQGQRKNNQRAGSSSDFAMVTVRACFEIWNDAPSSKYDHNNMSNKAPLTYIDQAIPSPYGLEHYESIPNMSGWIIGYNNGRFDSVPKGLRNLQYANDITGTRMKAYSKFLRFSKFCSLLHHCFSSPTKVFKNQPKQLAAGADAFIRSVKITLHQLRGPGKLFASASAFEYQSVAGWKGIRPKAKLMVPPVSLLDETTNEGSGGVVIQMAALTGLLNYFPDTMKFGLPWDLNLRWNMGCGDGMTLMRFAGFREIVEKLTKTYSFENQYEMVGILVAAMERILMISGDLHQGLFHNLKPVYDGYYGALLQPIQTGLRWKRINGKDITKTYHQAKYLCR
jgi:hypothetical protein